jgi:EAL domain-containing protein (putative c-di-GMP-specific phosphodiesterase class I)
VPELVLRYQPLVSLPSSRIAGFVAVAREQDLPLPTDDVDLLRDVDGRVVHEACVQARRWQLRYPQVSPLRIVVRLSFPDALTDEVVDDVEVSLRSSGLPAESLVLELPPTASAHDRATLAALGVRHERPRDVVPVDHSVDVAGADRLLRGDPP